MANEHGVKFEDHAERGPFAHWHHVHAFSDADGRAQLRDHIDYSLPLEPLSRWTAGGYARRELERMLRQRHVRTGLDAVVHLASETVNGRWTPEKMRRIYESRTDGTRLLCEALAATPRKPKVLVSASAVGIYGDTGERWVDESTPVDDVPGFLAEVCRAWEAATAPAQAEGIRVVNLRIGVVLSPVTPPRREAVLAPTGCN